MASFTAVDDTVSVTVKERGETVSVALSGTYSMVIKLQREIGSIGSGSYETLKQFDTANETVAYDYLTQTENEVLRLIVTTDTSGTCTATISDTSNLDVEVLKNKAGDSLVTNTQKFTKFHGGFARTSASIVNTTAALTLTEEDHAGRIVTLNSTTGRAITLPEATATGNVYTVFVGTTVSSGSHTIVAPSSSSSFIGGVGLSTDIAGVTILANTGDDTITMSGSTTGGVLGSWVRLTDVASGIFMLEGFLCSTGSEADPFSAGV